MGLRSRLPEFSGPYKVGTIDVEIPISELESACPLPKFGKGPVVTSVQYRLFYPCQPGLKKEYIPWLPNPPRSYASSYAKFLGLRNNFAGLVSYLPNPLSMVEIPAQKNAELLGPSLPNKSWPVMIFSHGLGGTRNTYSVLAGSIASYGMIVATPEHRDGSAPISFMSKTLSDSPEGEKGKEMNGKVAINYLSLPHTPTPEVEAVRNAQLKIRLWELGLIYNSLLKINKGEPVTNINAAHSILADFRAKMDVEVPGRITFAGHSFGAATMTQFVKSIYYLTQTNQAPTDYEPLYSPDFNSSIFKQITPLTPVILLDVWCLPLRAKSTRWLWDKPFPCYNSQATSGTIAHLLAIESEGFYKWKDHLKTTKALLTPDPSLISSLSSSSLSAIYKNSDGSPWPHPHFYYVTKSAHLSQSDFGLLFPWITKMFVGCEEPERIMKLNMRAILQFLRNHNICVSATSAADQELDTKHDVATDSDAILTRNNEIRGWNWIDTTTNDE